ncbi:helix-turn-helix domain-containing protein [Chachezhania sediminis]|uniref:helix-turn-helix domain-containing protein n=1 Tax=Chachezhania sediminis TaxID=2599291 RepID=UPI00131B4658|nr:helix-turn-helix domain-containing protein [Chachezhania sediminis]
MAISHNSCAETRAAPQVWQTSDVRQGEAFEFYREGICAAFMPLRPELARDRRGAFRASIASHRLGSGVLNLVTSRPHEVHRGRAEIAVSPVPCYYVNLQLGGACQIAQGRHEMTLRAGDVGIFDGAEPFLLDHGDCDDLKVASLLVPKATFDPRTDGVCNGVPKRLTAHGRVGAALGEAMRALAMSADSGAGTEARDLYDVVLSLAVLAARTTEETAPEDRQAAQHRRLQRIVAAGCADNGFTAATCAAEAGLSVGHLHNLFARQGDTFGSCLRRHRLQRAARLLQDPALAHLPVAEIGYRAGFGDASHFGRVFREAYGRTPADWRKGHHR